MRIKVHERGVILWLSAADTYFWARRPGHAWPCSQLSGNRVRAEFDTNGLVDLAINGRMRDVDGNEFNAITSDFLAPRLPKDHPCYFVCVGQFKEAA